MYEKLLFCEEFHHKEKNYIEILMNGKVTKKHISELQSHALRVINNENLMGFYAAGGTFNNNNFLKKAYENAHLKTDIYKRENNFISTYEIHQDVTEDKSISDIKDILSPLYKLSNLDTLITIKETEHQKKILNSFGVNGKNSLRETSVKAEVRSKDTKNLLLTETFNLKDIKRFLKISEGLNSAKVLDISDLEDKIFLISPNVMCDIFYPIQSLLLQKVCVTDKINPLLTILEVTKGLYSIPFDDEGVITTKKMIYNQGIYSNPEFKSLSNGESSGNGMRIDYRRKPSVSPLIWEMEQGSISIKDLLNKNCKFIMIDNMVQTRIDDYSGHMISNVISSYFIEDGEIKGIFRPYKIIVDPIMFFEDKNLIITKDRNFVFNGKYHFPYGLSQAINVLNIS